MKTLIAFLALLSSVSVAAQERYLVDWDAVGEETLQHLSELVKIDTSNPPGNETSAAKYVEAILAADGIEHPNAFGHHFLADPVTRDDGDFVAFFCHDLSRRNGC